MKVPLILASASPRRSELMSAAGYEFEVITPEVEEVHDESLSCEELTVDNAGRKALAVMKLRPEALVIGADTLVYLDGIPMAKPRDMEDAAAMLRRLGGRTHEVCTGIAIAGRGGGMLCTFHEISEVTFKKLTEEVIREYHARINPLDKAGAYAVQEESAMIIERVEGSWSNVKGLPMERLRLVLAEILGRERSGA